MLWLIVFITEYQYYGRNEPCLDWFSLNNNLSFSMIMKVLHSHSENQSSVDIPTISAVFGFWPRGKPLRRFKEFRVSW
jgi:hypothetical protein